MDEEPEDQDDLDDPDRYTEKRRNLQGRKERLFDDRQAPAGGLPMEGHEPGDGQGHDPADKEEDLEVVFDHFYLKRQDKDEEKNNQEPEVCKNVHSVHLFDPESAAGRFMYTSVCSY